MTSDRFTLHGFSLALAGVSLHEIMGHVGRKNSRTALHYIKLNQVVNPARAAAQPDLDCELYNKENMACLKLSFVVDVNSRMAH